MLIEAVVDTTSVKMMLGLDCGAKKGMIKGVGQRLTTVNRANCMG